MSYAIPARRNPDSEEIVMEHYLRSHKRPLGRGALAGSGMRYGTEVRCSCGEFEAHTNEAPPSRSKTWQRDQERKHLAEQTPEGDLRIVRGKLAKAQERLAEAAAEENPFGFSIKARLADINVWAEALIRELERES